MIKLAEYISWSPIRRLMKHNGAIIVARDAVDELVYWMSQSAEKLTKTALVLTKHANRKKVTRDDILLSIKYFSGGKSRRSMRIGPFHPEDDEDGGNELKNF